MYQIKRNVFNEIKRKHPDYVSRALTRHEWQGKVCEAGDWMAFDSMLPGYPNPKGTRLVFEHIHFEIVD